MKKFVFFTSLVSMSFAISCANNNPGEIYHKFSFQGACCSIDGNEKYSEEIKENESRVFNIEAKHHYILPEPEEIVYIPTGVVYEKNDDINATLTISKMDRDYQIFIAASVKEIRITFDSFYESKIIDTIEVPSGTKWSEIAAKPTPKVDDYQFNGWSLQKTGGGTLIKDDYVFNDDTTVYGSYDYICSLVDEENCSLKIANLEHKYNQNVVVSLTVKSNKTYKYELPLDISAFTINTNRGVIPATDCNYERGERYAKLSIKSSALINSGEISIMVDDYQPTYAVTVAKEAAVSHLNFFDEGSKSPALTLADAKKGDNYYFDVRAYNESPDNAVAYYIPSNFKIYVGGSTFPLDPRFYKIEPSDTLEGYTIGATIKIDGSVISGSIVIDADAYQVGYYQYEVVGLGGIKTILPKYAYATDSSNIQLDLTEEQNAGFPKTENLYVKIDGEKSEIKSIDKYPELFTYNRDLGRIVIARNNSHASFMFYAAADEYPLLNTYTWRDINTVSINGYAPYFFNVGDTKTVTMDQGNKQYEARILDFNHDLIAGSEAKAGITFDFTELIEEFTTKWEETGSCRDFPHSTLNKCLMDGDEPGTVEGAIYKMFKTISDSSGFLVDFIKTVSKDVTVFSGGTWKSVSYNTKLFPGSQLEVWDPNVRYKCYSMFPDSSAKGEWYWLRTPNKGGGANTARAISPEGGLGLNEDVSYYDFHVSPLFCV